MDDFLLNLLNYNDQTGLISANLLAKINDKIAINFTKIFNEGPDVSLSGSPTVSPTTAAL